MKQIKTVWSVLAALALLTTGTTFSAHHESTTPPDINGLFTLVFELGAEQTPWSVAIEDQEGATAVTRFQLTAKGKFANGTEYKSTADCGGLQEGAVNSGVCVWTDDDGDKNQVRFTCENAAGNGFCWGSGTGLTGKYVGKVNRWSQRNQDENVFAAGIWADAE